MGSATVKFRNWEKYQGESKRYDTAHWFRVESKIYLHEVWDLLNAEEFKAFVFLLAFTVDTAHKDGELKVAFPKWARLSGSTVSTFESLLEKLIHSGIADVTVDAPCTPGDVTVQSPCMLGETVVLRNERDDTKRYERDAEEAAAAPNEFGSNPKNPVEELINTIPPAIQVTWENVWGVELVQTEIPKAAAWWITNPGQRKQGDTFPRFANAWFGREKEQRERRPPPSVPKSNPKDKPPPTPLVEHWDPITGEFLGVAVQVTA